MHPELLAVDAEPAMSDPRRPALERDVDVHPRNPNGGLDYFGMLAMALGMAAMLTRMKVFAYGAIIAQARTKQTHIHISRFVWIALTLAWAGLVSGDAAVCGS